MADIFYHGVKPRQDREPRPPTRIEVLREEMLVRENERIQALTISKTKLIGELDGAGTQIERIIGESELSPREKKEVMAIWERTKRAALSARCEWRELLREARKAGPDAGKANGA
jgi:hypothetical protein